MVRIRVRVKVRLLSQDKARKNQDATRQQDKTNDTHTLTTDFGLYII
jgi:hypothetical protein